MDADDVTVVLAADDRYALQLATAARSVIDQLTPARHLQLCVLDMGIEVGNRQRMEATFDDSRVDVVWVEDLAERVKHLPNTWTGITRATYGRLYIPEVLPDTVHRALYLDCDVIARRCVGDLFYSDMDGKAAIAVPDVQSPFVSSTSAVPLWFDAGRAPGEFNFNAGVMLMDLDAWRAQGVTQATLEYLTDGRHHFAQDQEAINVVLAGRIGAMDPRWNQQAELFWKPYAVIQPYASDVISRLCEDPWIIHFSNRPKPWGFGYEHPFLDEWFVALDRTAFAGWRPSGPTRVQQFVKKSINGARRAGRRVGLLARLDDA
jgi:lipopolysaccharide biosynthesis glycosyltransferase